MERDDIYYQAMQARDYRFDGKFFVGVKTTGIYCRPICPAKPKRKNVEFFRHRHEAERAGYRPCLRCRPESAPQSPAWIGTSAVVRRAIKILHDRQTLDFDENRFADLFGVTARHLRRLFVEEIGKTPKQISFENRLNVARKLIAETALPLTEVAFAAGFNSVRRFNDAYAKRFKNSPGKSRRRRISEPAGLSISLPYRPPFDFEGLLRFYQNHQVGRLEWFSAEKMHRIVAFDGKVGQIAIGNDAESSKLVVEIDVPDTRMIHELISRVRTLFDLDCDPIIVANSLETDKKTGALLAKHPGIRLPNGWDPFEVAVGAILGQLVSMAQARALVDQLIELLGEDSGIVRDGRMAKLFPTPAQIAASDLQDLKTTAARKQTLIAFAKAVEGGTLSLEPTQDIEGFMRRVHAIRGIGPWTAQYIALKALRHTDAFPATDLILARAMAIHPKQKIAAMSPWRGYAAALYWRAYAGKLKKAKGEKQ